MRFGEQEHHSVGIRRRLAHRRDIKRYSIVSGATSTILQLETLYSSYISTTTLLLGDSACADIQMETSQSVWKGPTTTAYWRTRTSTTTAIPHLHHLLRRTSGTTRFTTGSGSTSHLPQNCWNAHLGISGTSRPPVYSEGPFSTSFVSNRIGLDTSEAYAQVHQGNYALQVPISSPRLPAKPLNSTSAGDTSEHQQLLWQWLGHRHWLQEVCLGHSYLSMSSTSGLQQQNTEYSRCISSRSRTSTQSASASATAYTSTKYFKNYNIIFNDRSLTSATSTCNTTLRPWQQNHWYRQNHRFTSSETVHRHSASATSLASTKGPTTSPWETSLFRTSKPLGLWTSRELHHTTIQQTSTPMCHIASSGATSSSHRPHWTAHRRGGDQLLPQLPHPRARWAVLQCHIRWGHRVRSKRTTTKDEGQQGVYKRTTASSTKEGAQANETTRPQQAGKEEQQEVAPREQTNVEKQRNQQTSSTSSHNYYFNIKIFHIAHNNKKHMFEE